MALVMGQREARQASTAVIFVAAANVVFGVLFLVIGSRVVDRGVPNLTGAGVLVLVAGAVLFVLGVLVRRGSPVAAGIGLGLFVLLLLAALFSLRSGFALSAIGRALVCAVVALLLLRALRSQPG